MRILYKFCTLQLVAILISCLTGTTTFAQDIHFSQFFEAPLLRNPSLAGIFNGDLRVQTVYRDQWNSVTNAYKTASFNGEFRNHIGQGDDFVTTGVQILYDRAGTVSWVSSQVLGAVNYHKSLSTEQNRYLSVGFMGGPVQRRLDVSKMTTESQYNGRGLGESLLTPQYTYFDGSVGMSYNAQLDENPENNMFAGLAYHHITKPKNSFLNNAAVELAPKWVASAGVRFSVTETSFLTVQGDYSTQDKAREAVMGALYGIKLNQETEDPKYTIHGGAFIRWNDAFIPVVKVDCRPFSFTLSYDVNISKLKSSSYGRGGFEAGISLMGFTRAHSSLNYLNCPRF